jgi:hypothetical protein
VASRTAAFNLQRGADLTDILDELEVGTQQPGRSYGRRTTSPQRADPFRIDLHPYATPPDIR